MNLQQTMILLAAAVAAGALNSVAGGGSFITFPSLLLTGLSPIRANATNTVALWPASLASIGGYRKQIGPQDKKDLIPYIATSLIGGLIGAYLLLHTPQSTFVRMIPWLMLVATLVFAFGPRITAAIRLHGANSHARHLFSFPVILFLQLLTSIYGGFFGAGIGILMLATLSLSGMENIHRMNAYKNILATAINGVAVVTFLVAKVVDWRPALLMMVGSIVGSYGCAIFVQKIKPAHIRAFVLIVAVTMTAYFFYRY